MQVRRGLMRRTQGRVCASALHLATTRHLAGRVRPSLLGPAPEGGIAKHCATLSLVLLGLTVRLNSTVSIARAVQSNHRTSAPRFIPASFSSAFNTLAGRHGSCTKQERGRAVSNFARTVLSSCLQLRLRRSVVLSATLRSRKGGAPAFATPVALPGRSRFVDPFCGCHL